MFKKPCKYELPYPVPFAVAPSARREAWVSYTYRGSSTTKSVLGIAIGFCSFFSIAGLILLVWQGWGSMATTGNGMPVPTLLLEISMLGGVVYFMWLWRKYNTRVEITVSVADGSCRFAQDRKEPSAYGESSICIVASKLWNEKHLISLVVLSAGAHKGIIGAFKDPTFAIGFAEQLSEETGLQIVEGDDSDLVEVQGSMRLGGKDVEAMENRIQDAPIYV